MLGGDVYAKGFLRSYAAYLGLDPVPLVEAYRSQMSSEPAPSGTPPQPVGGALGSRPALQPNWFLVGGVMAAIVLVLAVVSFLLGGPGSSDEGPAVAAPVTTAPPTTAAPTTTTAPTTTLPPGVNLSLRVTGETPSWTRVRVDGREVFQETMQAGATQSFNGKQEIELRLGNAGAVELTVNGKKLGPAGDPGQTITFTFPPGDPTEAFAQAG